MIEEIRRLMGATDFQPFAIHTSGGARHVVPSRDHASIAPKAKTRGGGRLIVWDDEGFSNFVSSLHIVSIEVLEEEAA